MDSFTTQITSKDIWQIEPAAKYYTDNIKQVAQSHQIALPHSASSKCGLKTLENMYSIITKSAEGIALIAPSVNGFASGSLNLRSSEHQIKKNTPFYDVLPLAWHNITAPGHIFSRLAWEKTIPHQNVGYILSIGLTRNKDTGNVRGSDLLKYLEDFFIKNKRSESWVDTEKANIRAISFYERHGYSIIKCNWGHCLLKKQLPSAYY